MKARIRQMKTRRAASGNLGVLWVCLRGGCWYFARCDGGKGGTRRLSLCLRWLEAQGHTRTHAHTHLSDRQEFEPVPLRGWNEAKARAFPCSKRNDGKLPKRKHNFLLPKRLILAQLCKLWKRHKARAHDRSHSLEQQNMGQGLCFCVL